jgi:ubiquinone/menaquinone biosynthesis C-methylase UbiE
MIRFRLYFYDKNYMTTGNENILYYNAIAAEYNDMLSRESDSLVREKVSRKFCDLVTKATVLDFGGGTGLDLSWLAPNNTAVFFCEPSHAMRRKAISSREDFANDNVFFLDDTASDFRQWKHLAPFKRPVDAVLANFAVLNCIADLPRLFDSLAIITRPGADMMCLVLSKASNPGKRGVRAMLKSFLHTSPTTIQLKYKNNRQTVYLYSPEEIISAAKPNFDCCSIEAIPGSDFTLLHFRHT